MLLSKISECALTYAVSSVIDAYGANITPLTLGLNDGLLLLACGASLGLAGAWLAAQAVAVRAPLMKLLLHGFS